MVNYNENLFKKKVSLGITIIAQLTLSNPRLCSKERVIGNPPVL
jgi:hypothetical protein